MTEENAPNPLQSLARNVADSEAAIAALAPTDLRTAPAWEMARGDQQTRLEVLLDRSVSELLDRAQVVVEVGTRLREVCVGRVEVAADCWGPFESACQELELCCDGNPQPYTPERALQLRVGVVKWIETATFYGRLAALRQGQASQPLCDRTGSIYLNHVDEAAIQGARFTTVAELRAAARFAVASANPDHSFSRVAVLDALRAARPDWSRTPRVLVVGAVTEAEARRIAQMFQRGGAVVSARDLPKVVDGDFLDLLFE